MLSVISTKQLGESIDSVNQISLSSLWLIYLGYFVTVLGSYMCKLCTYPSPFLITDLLTYTKLSLHFS